MNQYPSLPAFDDCYMPEPNSGCWLWLYGVDGHGYGLFCDKLAHRIMWRRKRGPIPKGMHVLHKCDTPLCVNIDHLFLGNMTVNMQDRDRKGRTARGMRHGKAKLTEVEVIAIRNDPRSSHLIGQTYSINPTTVGQIKRRETWKHIP